MRRWPALLCVLALAGALLGCTRSQTPQNSIADLVLRVGEDVGTEVETFDGQMAPGLAEALNAGNPNAQDQISLPKPPGATLVGSGRVARNDGSLTFFVMYQVKTGEAAVSAAVSELVDTAPWQIVGGQSSEGVSALNFQNTRNLGVSGTVVVQPLPTTDQFDVVVSRGGNDKTLAIQRRAFIPILGAEFQEKDGGLVVTRVIPGEAATSGLQDGDRIVRLAGHDVKDIASLQAALRSLAGGKDALTSVVYITKIAPDTALNAVTTLPSPRQLPKDFPAPFLVLNGASPIAVRWSSGAPGGTYEATLLMQQAPADILKTYRALLPQQQAPITADDTQGTSTTLTFASKDGRLSGTVTVDVYDQDQTYSTISIQLQSARAGVVPPLPGGAVPGGTPPAGATAPATTPPATTPPASGTAPSAATPGAPPASSATPAR